MIWSSKEKGARQVARILLIEDNNDIQEILYSLLSEDHEVLQAFSGTEGLRPVSYTHLTLPTIA